MDGEAAQIFGLGMTLGVTLMSMVSVTAVKMAVRSRTAPEPTRNHKLGEFVVESANRLLTVAKFAGEDFIEAYETTITLQLEPLVDVEMRFTLTEDGQ